MMNKLTTDANMSIDFISNDVSNEFLTTVFDQQFSEKINQQASKQNNEQSNSENINEYLNKEILNDQINLKKIDDLIKTNLNQKEIKHILNEEIKQDFNEKINRNEIKNDQQINDLNYKQESDNNQNQLEMQNITVKCIVEQKDQIKLENSNGPFNLSNRSTTEFEMTKVDEQDSQLNQLKENLRINKSGDMSIDESLILNDLRHIFEISTSSEFIISKPLKKMETPKRLKNRENEMDISCADNDSLVLREIKIDNNSIDSSLILKEIRIENSTIDDSLVLKEIKIENNPIDCLDNSPYLKSLEPPKQVFKLSRKRLNCETESPIKNPHLSNNLFKNHFNATPLISSTKKWRSATYNPMTSSPKKMEIENSLLKPIDRNIICNSINNKIDNLLVSNLNFLIQKSEQSPNLMGNYSSTYALPLISGRHKDLKTISPETLANLMNGEYGKSIGCFTIVDSRYPYEYEGGHIDGAKNMYHKEEINKYFFGTDKPTLITEKALINNAIQSSCSRSSTNSMLRDVDKNVKRLSVIKESENDENNLIQIELHNELANSVTNAQVKRHAIIFHCEFSSERGPSMCRFLRKIDRELNEICYPNLYYPEIYLLHGGYKLFFEKFKGLCYPQTYLPMHSSDHKQDLIKFRTKSKSWNCERKWKSVQSK